MILTTSTDGCVIIVEVDADREMGKGEYQVSDSMMSKNVKSGLFKDISEETDYDVKIYAYKTDLQGASNKMSNIINIMLLCGYFVATYVFLMGGYMHF